MGKKISQYTELATNPNDNDELLLELASSGAYRRVKYSNLKAVGAVVQEVGNTISAVATGTTVLPHDDTTPQNTEGIEAMTQAITPKATANILEIEAIIHCSNTVANNITAALFQDTTADALNAISVYQATATGMVILHLIHRVAAGTTSSTTFKIRVGGASAGTTTINGTGGNRLFGAIAKSSLIIREYKA